MADLTNQYTPRTMIAAMRQTPRPTSFLQEMTGINRRVQTHKTKYIEIDKVFGDQLIATYTARQGQPKVLGKKGYDNHIHFAPYLKERYALTDEDTEIRDAGTTIYDGIGDIDAQMMKGLNVLRDRFGRVDEQQIATAINTGKIAVSGDGVSYEIDFDQNADHLVTLTGTALWDNAASDPRQNLIDWNQLIDDKGAPGASWLIGDVTSIKAFIDHADIKDKLDNRRIKMGEINPAVLRQQRATYYGNWTDAGVNVDIYTYQGYYETTDGSTVTQVRYMPAGTVFMGSADADVRKHYAKISNVKARSLGFQAQQFPLVIEPEDGSSISIQLESAPMVGFHQPNAFVRAKVLA